MTRTPLPSCCGEVLAPAIQPIDAAATRGDPTSPAASTRTPAARVPRFRAATHEQQLSFDAYPKFIEDTFLSSQRLDPASDGRSDSRPNVREALPTAGDLRLDFDFAMTPNKPVILNPM